jgi:hypothetical protein
MPSARERHLEGPCMTLHPSMTFHASPRGRLASAPSILLIAVAAITASPAVAQPLAPDVLSTRSALNAGVAAAGPSETDDWENRMLALGALIKKTGALGTYLGDNGAVVVVVPESGSSEFTTADARSLGIDVTIETRPIEPEDVQEINMVAQKRAWSTRASEIHIAGFFDAKRGKVVLASDSAQDILGYFLDAFPGKVFIDQEPVVLQSRIEDYSSHWGGAEMAGPDAPRGTCTSGFSVLTATGNARMVTAAHCFAKVLGEPIHSPLGDTFGTVTRRDYVRADGDGINDFELVGGYGIGHAPKIYVGGTYENTFKYVASAGNAGFNTEYCWSGAATKTEQCRVHMSGDNAFLCYEPEGCTYHMQAFTGIISSEDTVSCVGDSGSPFYRKDGADVSIRGIVVAGPKPCFNTGTMWIETWNKINDAYHVLIKIH